MSNETKREENLSKDEIGEFPCSVTRKCLAFPNKRCPEIDFKKKSRRSVSKVARFAFDYSETSIPVWWWWLNEKHEICGSHNRGMCIAHKRDCGIERKVLQIKCQIVNGCQTSGINCLPGGGYIPPVVVPDALISKAANIIMTCGGVEIKFPNSEGGVKR